MTDAPDTHSDVETQAFHKKLFKISSGSTFSVVALYAVFMAVVIGDVARAAMAVIILLPCSISFYLAHRNRTRPAAYVFVIGFFLAYTAAVMKTPTGIGPSSGAYCALLIVSAFALDRRFLWVQFFASVAAVAFVYFLRLPPEVGGGSVGFFVETIVLICTFAFLVTLSRHNLGVRDALANRVSTIEETMPALSSSGRRVTEAAEAIKAIADRQRAGAVRQSSAVKETRQALQATLAASQEIARSSREVHSNAAQASENSEAVAEQVALLASRTQQISEVLDVIKGIANRSELLALNAGLEGVRAGEAGRGFSLVAGQMQRLSESVMGAVKDIEGMAEEVSDAIVNTQDSMARETDLARGTATATSEISLATQQQQASTEQVTRTMDEFVEVTDDAAEGSEQALASAADLGDVAAGLTEILEGLSDSRGNSKS